MQQSFFFVLFSFGLALGTTTSVSSENVTITGTIYVDNWFQFYFNGELVATDPVTYTPHNAYNFSFQAPKDGLYTFAIYAQDYSDNITGLEYSNQCVGDGGLRAIFSDGTVSNTNWKYKTIFYGPINYPSCFPSPNDDDTRLEASNCKNLASNLAGTSCTSVFYSYDSNWYTSGYNYSNWTSAVSYTVTEVGWGQTPSSSSGYLDPQTVDWGTSVFIWGSSLNFDNRVLFLYSYYHNSSNPTTNSNSNNGIRNEHTFYFVFMIIFYFWFF